MLLRNKLSAQLQSAFITMLCVFLITGCAIDRTTTGSIKRGTENSPSLAGRVVASDALGARYQKDPSDVRVAMQYAAYLTAADRIDQAVAVLRKLVIQHPKDRNILAAYGKALARSGNYEAALDAVRRAQTPESPDWSLFSTEAAMLDQLGATDDARAVYRRALQLAPREPSLLSNVGISYLASGQPQAAETFLRQAVKIAPDDVRVRQNLAFALGVQGKLQEARALYAATLSPDKVEENMNLISSLNKAQVAKK